jgi:hypothetical protein
MAKQEQLKIEEAPEVESVVEDGRGEFPEPEGRPVKKQNLHVVIAKRHLNKRRLALLEKRAGITKEIEELDAAILALE